MKQEKGKCSMNLEQIYQEEDFFPREITSWENREYGILFYNTENADSYDSNHAIIFKERVSDLKQVLREILSFYQSRGLKPIVYQAVSDEGYFEENKDIFGQCGFKTWTEEQRYMVKGEENTIVPNPEIVVQKMTEWREEFASAIFERAGEPWEIDVAKRAVCNDNTLFFVAFYEGSPVGMLHSHVRDGVCRGDYLLVATEFRNRGVGRALMHAFVEYCNANWIEDCYLWTDGETAERIYYEAGFRYVETKRAGRAVYMD